MFLIFDVDMNTIRFVSATIDAGRILCALRSMFALTSGGSRALYIHDSLPDLRHNDYYTLEDFRRMYLASVDIVFRESVICSRLSGKESEYDRVANFNIHYLDTICSELSKCGEKQHAELLMLLHNQGVEVARKLAPISQKDAALSAVSVMVDNYARVFNKAVQIIDDKLGPRA